jgi:hypothetical protein
MTSGETDMADGRVAGKNNGHEVSTIVKKVCFTTILLTMNRSY